MAMSRVIPLTDERVSEIMSLLNDEQRDFIISTSKQSKKSKWMEVLAKRKGIVLDSNLTLSQVIDTIDDWILQDVLDGGYGQLPYKCECGRSLRFQYIMHHKKQGKTYRLGLTCFEHYTNLSPQILKDIKNGFYHIDLERDQILVRFEKGYVYNLDQYLHLEIPEDISKQVALKLPLTDKQISVITKLMEEYKRKQIQKEIEQRPKSTSGILQTEQKFIPKQYRPVGDYTKRMTPEINYETLLEKHLNALKQIRKKEQYIPEGLVDDWNTIKQIVRDAKARRPFDYSTFGILLRNLLNSLGISHKHGCSE